MHDRTHTVTHALAESVRAASSHKSKNTASSSSASTTHGRRWKAGLKPGQAAKKLFPKPNFFQRAHRRFFIKRDLKYVRLPHLALAPLGLLSFPKTRIAC